MTSHPSRTDRSVVLCMIVKNEAQVLRECFDSVLAHIDCYSIVDTGSTDDTIEVIDSYFSERGIPGQVHRRSWKNFGHNRSEAFSLAREAADYALIMDADDVLHGTPDFSNLSADAYLFRIRSAEITYWRHQLLATRANWRYEGVVHEFATCDDPAAKVERMEGDWWVESRRLGARNLVVDKYKRDADLLREHLTAHPDDSRAYFYLGQSCFDMGDFESALVAYARRATMGGWEEEVYFAKYRVGLCLMNLERPRGEILEAMLGAWEFRPGRAEPLHQLARWHRERSMHHQAVMFARTGLQIPLPKEDILFVSEDVYAWRLADELAVSTYYTGNFSESLQHSAALVRSRIVPDEHQERIQRNLELATEALAHRAQSHTGK